MPEYRLSVHSLTPPALPAIPEDAHHTDIRSGLSEGAKGSSYAAATSPLRFTLSLPDARPKNPLHPATHLQVTYFYAGSGESYVPRLIMPTDVVKTDADDDSSTLYEVELGPADISRVKVNEGETPDAEVRVNAWRNERLLGQFTVGVIKGLGIEGLKSWDLAKRRVEYRKEEAAKKAAA
ncbi:hypothetical protein LMH87_003166 [Akanthomyces muscarius]|uniref:Uncharacterized protein n=1 Tax=Akanthomyces muscarius TaxID=2231603 RepID=A0A9W8Q0X8_AKAMU|nr:hypothetical protein LMH87_003166 [Akanthomyces muscarius]KAJ4144276.1 hypothetical protein LMH87_003166 [Akanthomyces muscarius]